MQQVPGNLVLPNRGVNRSPEPSQSKACRVGFAHGMNATIVKKTVGGNGLE